MDDIDIEARQEVDAMLPGTPAIAVMDRRRPPPTPTPVPGEARGAPELRPFGWRILIVPALMIIIMIGGIVQIIADADRVEEERRQAESEFRYQVHQRQARFEAKEDWRDAQIQQQEKMLGELGRQIIRLDRRLR